jgi:hypothetical protein
MTFGQAQNAYKLPPGERPLLLWTLGIEPRIDLTRERRVQVTVGGRGLIAQRRFTLESADQERTIGVSSQGSGVGATVSFDLQVRERLDAIATLSYDRISFDGYRRIQQQATPTDATWTATGLRFGFVYHPW